MKTRLFYLYLLFFFVVFIVYPIAIGASTLDIKTPEVNIGVLYDGESESFTKITTMLKSEIIDLTQQEFSVNMPDKNILSGHWDVRQIKKAANQLLNRDDIDIVIGIGIAASNEFASRKAFPKPVVASLILYPEYQGLDPANGTSNKENFVYNKPENTIERNIAIFKRVTGFKHLTILVEQMVCDSLTHYRLIGREAEKKFGITIDVTCVEASAEKALASLPKTTDAVIVSPLLRLSETEKKHLAEGLITKKIPGFSMWGKKEVEHGLLAGAAPESEFDRLIRRTAINVQRILLGEKPEDIQTHFFAQNALVINMKTAAKLDISPSWDVMDNAELLYNNDRGDMQTLSLESSINHAIRSNLSLKADASSITIASANVKKALSYLVPEVKVSATARTIDENRAEYSNGTESEETTYYGAELTQVLFSEQAFAGYTAMKYAEKKAKHDYTKQIESIRYETARAYINLLKAETLKRITQNNLKLTRANYKRAKLRKAVGVASPSEVHRWESEISKIKMEVNNADADLKGAENRLNTLMNQPLNHHIKTIKVTPSSPVLITDNKQIVSFVSTPEKFEIFMQFMVKQGIARSPSINALKAALRAKERLVLSAKRAHFLPDIILRGKIEKILDRGGYDQVLPAFDKEAWSVGVNLSFPLFTGGRKQSEYIKTLAEQTRLEYLLKAATAGLEEKIRYATNKAGASYAAIDLSEKAASAAGKNLDIVTDGYSRGAISVISLVDAQNAKTTADLGAANAVYDFVMDVITLQRSIGKTDFSGAPELKKELYEKLVEYDRSTGNL